VDFDDRRPRALTDLLGVDLRAAPGRRGSRQTPDRPMGNDRDQASVDELTSAAVTNAFHWEWGGLWRH